MASEVKTNKVSPATSTTLNVGDAGDTLALAVDAVTGLKVGSDAQGDILYYDGTDYTRREKPGTPAGEVLTFATSATAPTWVAPAATGDNTPAFAAYIAANKHPGDNSWGKIAFDQEYFDTDSAYDHVTNYRFTCPTGKGGKYMFAYFALADDTDSTAMNKRIIGIYLNGSRVRESGVPVNYYGENQETLSMTAVITLVPTDYVEFYGLIDSSSVGGAYFLSNSGIATWVTGWRLNGV